MAEALEAQGKFLLKPSSCFLWFKQFLKELPCSLNWFELVVLLRLLHIIIFQMQEAKGSGIPANSLFFPDNGKAILVHLRRNHFLGVTEAEVTLC